MTRLFRFLFGPHSEGLALAGAMFAGVIALSLVTVALVLSLATVIWFALKVFA